MGNAAYTVTDVVTSDILADGDYTEQSPGYMTPADFITVLGFNYQDIVDHYELTLSNYKFIMAFTEVYSGGTGYNIYPTDLNITVSGGTILTNPANNLRGYRKYQLGDTTSYIEVTSTGLAADRTKANIGTRVAAYQRIRTVRHMTAGGFSRSKMAKRKDADGWKRANI